MFSSCLAHWGSITNNGFELELVFIPLNSTGQRIWDKDTSQFLQFRGGGMPFLQQQFGREYTPFVTETEIGVTFKNEQTP